MRPWSLPPNSQKAGEPGACQVGLATTRARSGIKGTPVAKNDTSRGPQGSCRFDHSRCDSSASNPRPYTPAANKWQTNSAIANNVDAVKRHGHGRSRKATHV